jgi:hypothetical protein
MGFGSDMADRWEEQGAFDKPRKLVEKKCYWEYKSGHGGEWHTSCGACYDADDFGCDDIYTCPNCNKETAV